MADMTNKSAPGVTVRTATAADLPVLAAVLGAAFDDDPLGQWMFPDEATRADRLIRLFDLYTRRFVLPHGEVRVAGDDGAALWLPPDRWRVPPLLAARALPGYARLLGRRFGVFSRGMARLEREHPREPHWYLPFIGVTPVEQSRGVGSALLAAVLDICDRTGVPAYLEASTPRNAALYERHGFETRHELALPDGPTTWAMWREPRSRD